MRPLVLGLLLVFSHPVVAQTSLKFHNREVTVMLYTQPCIAPSVLSAIKPESHGLFRTSSVLWRGKSLAACWMLLETGNVLIVDEQQEYILLPSFAFRAETGV